ncbi:MAG: T9SS C-terminal target domain-containing protein, partial [Bacteroidetes bacterium]|nr:T9SS C-terminal target domain-containing protein [Bacteroidota bacterium]
NSSDNSIRSTTIVDMNGRIVFQKIGFQNNIQVKDLKTGMYFIQLTTDNGITSKRILID